MRPGWLVLAVPSFLFSYEVYHLRQGVDKIHEVCYNIHYMSYEIGGLPTGAERMPELFETAYDDMIAASLNVKDTPVTDPVQAPESAVQQGCSCHMCNDGFYQYI